MFKEIGQTAGMGANLRHEPDTSADRVKVLPEGSEVSGAEHEWLLCPQGHVSGRAPVELMLLPDTEEIFRSGWVVTWRASAGAALSCDTFLIGDQGPQVVTPADSWPLKRIRIQGAEFVRPDVLLR